MRSMTGFGKSLRTSNKHVVNVEVRSVNNRFFDLSLRMPRELSAYELDVRKMVQRHVTRGKVNVTITIELNPDETGAAPVDIQAARKRFSALQALSMELDIDEKVSLNHLLQFPEIFAEDLSRMEEDELRELLFPTLEEALQQLDAVRLKEGMHLHQDLVQRLATVRSINRSIKEKGRSNIKSEFDRLLQNVTELIGQQKLDRNRLEQEVAVIADRVDITEEAVRLDSHIKLFEQTLEQKGEAGKKLNFILQEMHREANTMNSKTTDVEISHWVIRLKEEIEKMREQVQNLE